MLKLLFMGDSTMQHNTALTYPQVGWPDALRQFIKENVPIMNFAHNGCSTKSFRDLGYFDELIKHANKGDYCFIEFGHNDEKKDNEIRYTSPFGTYKENLNYFIDKLEKKGTIPILLTPIYRRKFSDGKLIEACHKEYQEAMIEVAKERKVYLIDLTKLTHDLFIELGDEGTKRLFMHFDKNIYENYPNGMSDDSHLRYDGAFEICKLVVKDLFIVKHPIRDILSFESFR